MLSAALPLQTESPSTEPNPTLQGLETTQPQTQQQVQQTSTSEGGGSQESSLGNREDKGGQQQEVAPKRLLTDEDIAALKSAMPQPVQQQVQQQQPLTQEQIDTLLHVWKPDAKWYERVSAGGEDAVKAFAEQRDGMNRQFSRRMQLEIMQLRQELAPGMASAAAVAEQAEESKFYGANKDLDPHRDIVRFMYDNLSKAGKLQGMTPSQMYKAVADETRAYCKSKGITLAASAPSSGGAPRNNARKVPAQLNGTNQGGGAGGQSADSPTVAALRRVG